MSGKIWEKLGKKCSQKMSNKVYGISELFDYRMATMFSHRNDRKPPLVTSQNRVQPRSSGDVPVPLMCWLHNDGLRVPNRSVREPSFFWNRKWQIPFCICLMASSIINALDAASVLLPVRFEIADILVAVIWLFDVTII